MDKLNPKVLLAGSKRDVMGLTQPAHMCSNCYVHSVNSEEDILS